MSCLAVYTWILCIAVSAATVSAVWPSTAQPPVNWPGAGPNATAPAPAPETGFNLRVEEYEQLLFFPGLFS
jgi:hypothetical protein